MGISIYVKDWDVKVENDIRSSLTSEEIAFCQKWQSTSCDMDDADASFDAYAHKIKPIERKYSMDFANGNFQELLEMLEVEFSYCGELSGIGLSEFCLKLRGLRNVALNNPNEFCTPSIAYGGDGRALVINVGKDVSYWISRLSELIELCESTDSIYWA